MNIAGLEVQLPSPDAEVWLQGEKQTGSGAMRRFYSPQLEPGKSYTYTINAAWFENGELVTQKRQVDVQADTLSRIDFTQAADMPEPEVAPPPVRTPPPPPPATTPRPPARTPPPPALPPAEDPKTAAKPVTESQLVPPANAESPPSSPLRRQ